MHENFGEMILAIACLILKKDQITLSAKFRSTSQRFQIDIEH